MKIIIPLQTCSTRILNKNLRDFVNGESLFDVKAKQLLRVFDPKKIFVSSEISDVEEKSAELGLSYLFKYSKEEFECIEF